MSGSYENVSQSYLYGSYKMADVDMSFRMELLNCSTAVAACES